MSYWNYRAVRRKHPGTVEETMYYIYEVYYNDDDSIRLWCEGDEGQGMLPMGETPEELKGDLEYMMKALKAPIIDYDDLPDLPQAEELIEGL